jgi:hypothetical protein
LQATTFGADGVHLNWVPCDGATSYQLQGKPTDVGSWRKRSTTDTTMSLDGLFADTYYEWKVRALCDDGTRSDFSTVDTFLTPQCLSYCSSVASTTVDEWIEDVMFKGVLSSSGNNGGYVDFGTSIAFTFFQDEVIPFALTPGFTDDLFPEYFRIWIDYNRDGDFNDADELAFDQGGTGITTVIDSFTVPATAIPGRTGMRIQMKFLTPPGACSSFTFGEVEDYCIRIEDSGTPRLEAPTRNNSVEVYPNPISNSAMLFAESLSEGYGQIQIFDMSGRLVYQQTASVIEGENNIALDLSSLANGIYQLEMVMPDAARVQERISVVK